MDDMNEARKDVIRQAVESAVVHAGRFGLCRFGQTWTVEEREFAVSYGSNFNVRPGETGLMVTGMTR